MKILIINQHSQNHGDEAAGRALVRKLLSAGYSDITVSYNTQCCDDAVFFIHEAGVKQFKKNFYPRGIGHVLRLSLKRPNFLTRFLVFLYGRIREDRRLIRNADVIINAPGGINMGAYCDNLYLWRLKTALELKKHVIMYSSSIGPFDMEEYFVNISRDILRRVDFLSLRDAQSCRYAEEMGRKAVPSIDTAFLMRPAVELPPELQLPPSYVVVVPHQLYAWHPKFRNMDRKALDHFYKKLLEKFAGQGVHLVLLPQIFANPQVNDEKYFESLAAEIPNCQVIPTRYNSDIQQKIIQGADFLIGARYHSTVFAVNNEVPFYSLSYEHKMVNMLETLGLKNCCMPITEAMAAPDKAIHVIFEMYRKRSEQQAAICQASVLARAMAEETFEKMNQHLKTL